jgi:transcriptional regulator with GAF, ATPase, and Fis domain
VQKFGDKSQRPGFRETGLPQLEFVLHLVEPRADRAAHLKELAKNLTVPIQVHPKPDAALASRAAVVLIGLERPPVSHSAELSAIHRLRAAGATIVAYADGVRTWEIRTRCLPLAAGVSHLFDWTDERFATDLISTLRQTLATTARRTSEQAEIASTMRRLGIVAGSKAMFAVLKSVLRFSLFSDLPVLIVGETGTGKEGVARALHELDRKRSRGPFVPVNCGALSSSLVESELFGHRRGAFTGADRDRRGLIRAAHGGVLFLDEVGELPDSTQTKLLRTLQEGRVLTVGDEREEPVDVRIIAATNRDLAALVAQGAFRADLFHRLNVLPLPIPPLRERPGDIRPLAEYFIGKHAGPMGREPPGLADETVEALEKLQLPGNARQLENIVRQALVQQSSTDALQLSDLPPEVWNEISAAGGESSADEAKSVSWNPKTLAAEVRGQFNRLTDLNDGRLEPSLAFCERMLICIALERTRGNQSEMARLLRITPRSVYNKLRKHQLRVGRDEVS